MRITCACGAAVPAGMHDGHLTVCALHAIRRRQEAGVRAQLRARRAWHG